MQLLEREPAIEDDDVQAAQLVVELWRRNIRIYPDIRDPDHLGIDAPPTVDYSDLRPQLVARRTEVYWHLWDSFSPQSAGEYAAFCDFHVGQVAAILRRGVIERRYNSDRFDRTNYAPHIWTDDRIEQLAEHCVNRAMRYPEWLVSHGLGRWPKGPRFPLNEEVAYTILELAGSPAEALAVLERRNAAHQLGFTRDELVRHVAAAGMLLADTSDDYDRLFWATLMRRQ